MAKVLIIDDDIEMCMMLSDLVVNVQHDAEYALTLKDGLDKALRGDVDVVFLDVRMPDGNGLDIMGGILKCEFPPEIIIMTGMGDSDGAELAIKNGAWDYIQKPLSPKKIILPLNRVLQYRDGIRSIAMPQEKLLRADIIGGSQQIQECLNMVAKAAHTSSNVLITGETGTGKELFARAIHSNSSRRNGNFVVVDCAALSETLVESALFGHEKGSFTGADRSVKGLVTIADGGTLFLDEVGEMNLNLQKAFLRVLQERKYRPVGSKKEIASDFRLVAATNRIPSKMVEEGRFREDLLYRLNAIPIHLPPLRERIGDMEELVTGLTSRIYRAQGIETKTYSQDFITTLKRYRWPGNVRELVNILEAAISEAFYEPVLFPKHLLKHIRITMARSSVVPHDEEITPMPEDSEPAGQTGLTDDQSRSEVSLQSFKAYRESVLLKAEETYLNELMVATRGNIKEACDVSGLGRTRLYNLLKKHAVDRMGWGR